MCDGYRSNYKDIQFKAEKSNSAPLTAIQGEDSKGESRQRSCLMP